MCLVAPASAQFVNPALWLGDEHEAFRRDYAQGPEYFLDRAAYVDRPPWWFAGGLDPFQDRLSAAAGSVSSRELIVEAAANVGVDMGRGFVSRFHYLQSEHQTARFQRFALGIDKAVSDSTAVFVQLEGTAAKSRSDLSLGLELSGSDRSAHRLSFTLVDFSRGKSDEFEYERMPYGLLFAGSFGDAEGHDLAYELGVQLPFVERDLATGELLGMRRTVGSVEARARLGPRDRLILGLEGELTSKSLEPDAHGATTTENADIELARLKSEWWHRGALEREYSIGAWYLTLEEDYERPDDPDGSAATRRRELMLFALAHFPLGGAWSLEPYVMGGRVELESSGPDLEPVGVDHDGFQGKCGLPLRYFFSEYAWMRVDLSMQLEEFAFAGGAVQLVASF
jgi:hypothetical protein